MALSETSDSTLKRSKSTTSLGYLFIDMGTDLKLMLSFMIISIAFTYIPFINQSFIRYALGIILVLFIPGYCFICVVFPGKRELESIERAILSVGFSIVLVPIIGYLLNFTPWGIRLEFMTVWIMAFTAICCCIANLRRHGLSPDERFSIGLRSIYKEAASLIFNETQKDKTQIALSVVVVISLLLSIMAVAYVLVMPRNGEGYTEFYINGPGGKAVDYPTQYTLGEQKPIIIGIVNKESRNVSYFLNVSLSDPANRSMIYSEQVGLADNQTWEKLIYLKPDRIGTNMTMDFLLYADGNQTAPYRACTLFINVSAPVTSGML